MVQGYFLSFTRQGSQVRSLYRPPSKFECCRQNRRKPVFSFLFKVSRQNADVASGYFCSAGGGVSARLAKWDSFFQGRVIG